MVKCAFRLGLYVVQCPPVAGYNRIRSCAESDPSPPLTIRLLYPEINSDLQGLALFWHPTLKAKKSAEVDPPPRPSSPKAGEDDLPVRRVVT